MEQVTCLTGAFKKRSAHNQLEVCGGESPAGSAGVVASQLHSVRMMPAVRENHYHVAVISAAIVALVTCVMVYRFCRQVDLMAARFQLDTGPQSTLLYDRHGQLVFSLHEEERIDRRLNELATSPQHIIPGHDPQVMKRYPAPTSDLQGIVVRLD